MLKNQVILPLYHAVNNIAPSHLKYLYRVKSVDEFRKDVEGLLKIARPVSLGEIIENARNRKAFIEPVFHFTFDDGLREFHDIVAPVLLEKGITATCFLNSAFIDNKEMFYRLKSSLLIEKLHNTVSGSSHWSNYHEWLRKNNLKQTYYQKVLLSIQYNSRHLIDELADILEVDFKDFLAAEKPYLSSNQIEDLIKKGFTFGAHTIDHPDFQYLSEAEQFDQTSRSVDLICKRFNLDYKVFSFPYTDAYVNTSFFKKLNEEKIVDLTFECAGMKKDSIITNYQRIPMEIYSDSAFGILKKEIVYNKMLGFFGKNIIFRS